MYFDNMHTNYSKYMRFEYMLGLLSNCRDDFTKVNLEKLACASCQHPFIINLDYAFQTNSLAIMVYHYIYLYIQCLYIYYIYCL